MVSFLSLTKNEISQHLPLLLVRTSGEKSAPFFDLEPVKLLIQHSLFEDLNFAMPDSIYLSEIGIEPIVEIPLQLAYLSLIFSIRLIVTSF